MNNGIEVDEQLVNNEKMASYSQVVSGNSLSKPWQTKGHNPVSLSMKIKGESTSLKVLPWDPFATFNVTVLIHSFVHIGERSEHG
jgi:hypothetical protein